MSLWYWLVGIGFIVAGAYKILLLHNSSTGMTWIIIGILFGLLAWQKRRKD